MPRSVIFNIARWVFFASLVFPVVGCDPRQMKQIDSATTIREIRASLQVYVMTHDGALPQSLQALTDDIKKQDSSYTAFGKWSAFYYLAHMKTNDPLRTPVVMSDPKKEGKRGLALLLNGEVLFFQDLDQESIRQITTEPWEFVRRDFVDEQAFEAFKKRLVLQPPAR